MEEQKVECEAKIEIFQKAIKGLKKDINAVKDLPGKLTPEFIWGCTKEERNHKFQEALKELNRQRHDANDKLKEFQSKLVKIGKKKLAEIKGQVEPKLKQYKKISDDLESSLKTMMQNFKNDWTPPPRTEMRQVEDKVEVENEDVNPGILIITADKTTITDDSANIHITLGNYE